ncbi:ABC transporter transmembrane domain-containing protein [Streptomyces sp. NPDC050704]|uniref:ABC transporter transmembrane domain-containing protein n=1 Tax=Streptomyces sp. NPDC050704 TaxID=3157219 RepID=UPI0034492275
MSTTPAVPKTLDLAKEPIEDPDKDPRKDQRKERSAVRSLLRLWPYVRPVRGRLFTAAVVAVVASCAGLVIPLVLKWMVDGPVAGRDTGGVWLGALFLFLLGVVEAVLFGLRRWLVARPLAGVEAAMRADLYRHLQRLPVAFHDRWPSGQLLSRGTTDLMLLRMFLAFPLTFLLVNGVTILVGVIIMLAQEWTLGLVLLAPAVPVMIVCWLFEKRYSKVARQAQDQVGDLTTLVEESVLGIRIIKGFGRHRSQALAFRDLSRTLRGTELAKARLLAAIFAAITILPELAIGAALVLGTVQVADGELSTGTLVAFLSTALALRWPIESIGFLLAMSQEAATATERYFEVLDAEPESGGAGSGAGAASRTGSGTRAGTSTGSGMEAGTSAGAAALHGGTRTTVPHPATASGADAGAEGGSGAAAAATHGGTPTAAAATASGAASGKGADAASAASAAAHRGTPTAAGATAGADAAAAATHSGTRTAVPAPADAPDATSGEGASATPGADPAVRRGTPTAEATPAGALDVDVAAGVAATARHGRTPTAAAATARASDADTGAGAGVAAAAGHGGSPAVTAIPATAPSAAGTRTGGLQFHGVRFRYPDAPADSTPILDRIDLHIRPGETMALVGATGTGKTTLTALVPRLHEVTRGRITLDGVDITDMPRETLRALVAVAFEEPTLFSASVGENVLMGAGSGAGEAELNRALAVAQADFTHGLPQGTDTQVGEQGLSLSGGQRQRLALARAVVGRPRFLVLDDPLSALDVHTETLVEAALRRVLAETTALVVAHRPSTVLLADRVALLSRGRIAAVGTHHELLRTNAEYAWLMSGTAEGTADRTTGETAAGTTEEDTR